MACEDLRNLNDWEINEFDSLLTSMCSISLDKNYDQPVSSFSSIRNFIVGSFYRHLAKDESTRNNFLF